jgi:hypothetical protein
MKRLLREECKLERERESDRVKEKERERISKEKLKTKVIDTNREVTEKQSRVRT